MGGGERVAYHIIVRGKVQQVGYTTAACHGEYDGYGLSADE
jgi:acylphosphatase